MPGRFDDLLLLEEPRLSLLLPAVLARACGRRVRFARPVHRGGGDWTNRLYRAAGISYLSSRDIAPGYDYYGYFARISDAAEIVIEMPEVARLLRGCAHRGNGGSDMVDKLKICLWNRVKDEVTGLCELSWMAAHVATARNVSLLPVPRPFLNQVFRAPGWGRISPLYHLAHLITLAGKAAVMADRGWRRIARALGRKPAQPKDAPAASARTPEPEADTLSDARVVYFVHHGIEFGNLYEADYVLSSDRTHPLHRDNIVFYCHFAHDIAQPYRRKLCHIRQTPVVAILRATWALAREAGAAFSISGLAVAGALASIEENIRLCRDNLARVPSLELGIVGYDIMCPPEFIVAAQSLGIRCVGVQERSNTLGAGFFALLLDDYFITGVDAEAWVNRRSNMRVSRMHQVGPVRASWLSKRDPADTLSTPVRTVAVFDSKSLPWHDVPDLVSLISWENNRLFLEAVLALAERYPEIEFVIRGKNTEWRDLAFFTPVVETIGRLPNVRVEDDYSRPRISYHLVETSDLCICRYTSLGEEALASGRPVIFFEETVNGDTWVRGHCDYREESIYAHDRASLERLFDAAAAGRHVIDADRFQAFTDRAFSTARRGTPYDRIHAELNRFLGLTEAAPSPADPV